MATWCLLVSVPIAIWVANAALNIASRRTRSSQRPHVTPFVTGAIVNAIAVPLFTLSATGTGDPLVVASALAYAIVYVNCLVFLNWFIFTVTDVSMHVHILVEIQRRGPIATEDLLAIYNKAAIVRARVPRLVELKQLRLEDGRLYSRGSGVYLGAQMCLALRKVLGIPAHPEDVTEAPTSLGSLGPRVGERR